MRILTSKEREDFYFNILTELWDKYKKTPFLSSIITNRMKELNADQALSTHMVTCGYLRKLERGVCMIKYKPSRQWVQQIIDTRIKKREDYVLQKKIEKELVKSSVETLPVTQIEPVLTVYNTQNDIEQAISLLKSLGYKVLQPIEPQYKEI